LNELSAMMPFLSWSFATIGVYWASKQVYQRWRRIWLMPIAITPLILVGLILGLHESYQHYIRSAGWLVGLLAPATIAFAAPLYEKRAVIRKHWPILLAGMIAGSLTAVSTSYGLASLLGIEPAVRLSLAPRSLSTPFAMAVSDAIGGIPSLTAFFVLVTGFTGIFLGDATMSRLPLRSTIARGAALGMSAHAAGTAKAYELGFEEGTIAGLVMILSGLLNVAMAPLFGAFFRSILT
jgi:predicted murein hydrolase (TIGR00659 family)